MSICQQRQDDRQREKCVNQFAGSEKNPGGKLSLNSLLERRKNHRELHVSQVNQTSHTSNKTEKERQLLKDVVVKTSVFAMNKQRPHKKRLMF